MVLRSTSLFWYEHLYTYIYLLLFFESSTSRWRVQLTKRELCVLDLHTLKPVRTCDTCDTCCCMLTVFIYIHTYSPHVSRLMHVSHLYKLLFFGVFLFCSVAEFREIFKLLNSDHSCPVLQMKLDRQLKVNMCKWLHSERSYTNSRKT